MMTREKLAQRLTERQVTDNIIHDVEKEDAKASGLVVVHGGGDDLAVFSGAIHDERFAGHETEILLSKDGEFVHQDTEDNEDFLREIKLYDTYMEKFKNKITTVWDEDDISWQYRTEIPHSTFKIMDEGEVYCIGIVFNLSDLK